MPQHDGTPFAAFEKVRLSYDGARFALDGLDLRIDQGQFVCLLGGNGSGKSTLAKCMNALVSPNAGRVVVFGRDTADLESAYFIRSNMGLVLQSPDDQLVASVVEDDVAFGPENLGIEHPELEDRVARALRDVGLASLRHREVLELSGGQRQRVALAGALAMEPAMLVLDEATSMLDPQGRADLLRLCSELHADGMTIVMITHFMEEAAVAERVVVLDHGHICMDGTPDEVLACAGELRSCGLDVPFAASVSLQLAQFGIDSRVCVRLEGLVDELERLRAQSRASCVEPASGRAAARQAGRTVARQAVGEGEQVADSRVAVSAATDECMAVSAATDARAAVGAATDARAVADANAGKAFVARGSASTVELGPAAVELDGVSVLYDPSSSSTLALDNVSILIRQGEFVCVAGRGGSGKSTLLQLMASLERPTKGRVELGIDVSQVGLVLQSPERQLFASTVHDDVAFGPRNLGLGQADVDIRVSEALSLVGLDFDEVAHESPFALSGGQQRKVAMAGVLAMRPKLLLLDEPACGLDAAAREEMLALVADLNERGVTCVMVSHSMDDIARVASRVILLDDGSVCADGAPDALLSNHALLERLGLDVPAPQALALSLRERGWHLPRRLYDEISIVGDVALELGLAMP